MKLLVQQFKYYFMSKISIIILLIIICSCSSDKLRVSDNIERIPIDIHDVSHDASSFIEKIEIIPLETTDSSLIGNIGKIMYDKNMDMYAILGRNQIVSTFSGNGSFIATSKNVKGEGPKEHNMVLNMQFNPYVKGLDLLNPYGIIYTYSPTFKFISKKNIKSRFFLEASMALSPDEYIITFPAIWTNQEVDFVNLKTNQTNVTNYSGTISSGNTMDRECFYRNGDNFYFVPKGLNYYFYQIDQTEKKLIPIIYLDFGDSEIQEEDLPGCAVGEDTGVERTKSDNKRDYLIKGMQERSQFIREGKLLVPLIKFFNDDYIYVYFARGRKGYGGHYIYNRRKKQSFLVNEDKPFIMHPCFGIVDNVLMAICDAYYVPKLVDSDLMSSEEIYKMEQLKEEDNPVILKYYLRK